MKKLIAILLLFCLVIPFGYSCDAGNTGTKDNFTFFSTKMNAYNVDEITPLVQEYAEEKGWDLTDGYKIYNYTSKAVNSKYHLNLFEVRFPSSSYYFAKHKNDIYPITPYDHTHENNNCITHAAITDINDDGYIEILTSVSSFKDRGSYFYCGSNITVIDTRSKNSINQYQKGLAYFKENEEGVISIYGSTEATPAETDLVDGKLNERFYAEATKLLDASKLNTSEYTFKQHKLTVACDMFKAEITVNDGTIKFPYLFRYTVKRPSFEVAISMTYLGETYSYTSGTSHLAGATVTFVNGMDKITRDTWDEATVVTDFTVTTGQVIASSYNYSENQTPRNKPGTYDMVISYTKVGTGEKQSVTVENFLTLTR